MIQEALLIQSPSEDRKTAKEATKRPPIDPMTRSRDFHFSFKVDVKDRPEQVGIVRTDSAKGMDEAEAWAKIFKRERNSGYYERVYDQEVTAIYAWNGVPLWRKGQGMITQPVRARRSHRIRIVQPGRSSSGVSTIR